MNFTRCTVGLAALGFACLAANADETANVVQAALASTTLGGYVDTSAQWNFGTGNANLPPYKFGGAGKADGFNLDVVQLTLEKPLSEEQWAAGYRADIWYGPDATTLGTQFTGSKSDLAIRQAYVHLQVPIENGLELKAGIFDSIIGYELLESWRNPNYTRSYGHSLEPQTHTGLLASYRFNNQFSASVGVADTVNSVINSRATSGSFGNGIFGSGVNAYAESYKAYMGSLQYIAPYNWGWLGGSGFYGGIVNGYNNSMFGTGIALPTMNSYVGATLHTPIDALRLGVAWDRLDINTQSAPVGAVKADAWSVAGYASYQATEKISLHARLEYATANIEKPSSPVTSSLAGNGIFATTATVQYDLWQNVLTRLEFRWDKADHGNLFGGTITGNPTRQNAFLLAANIIYKF